MERTAEQVQHLAHQATDQVEHVTSEWRVQMSERSIQMRDRLCDSIRSVSSELRQMASMPSTSGNTGHKVARQGAEILDRIASGLESREPGDWIVEARQYARRHPTQVMGALFVSGLIFGRIARSGPSVPSPTPPRPERTVDLRATDPGYLP